MKRTFEEDLQRAISFHGHLCGGQLTGVRMARYALNYFGIEDPDTYRDLVVYVECDRCLTDAIMTVTNCHPGKRRMKLMDFGKQSAVFYDIASDQAIRLTNISEKAPKDVDIKEWFAQRSDEDLFRVQRVKLHITEYDLPGRPKSHTPCEECGDEITDGREVTDESGRTLCRYCAGNRYYELIDEL